MKKTIRKQFLFLAMLLLFVAACRQEEPTPTPAPTFTAATASATSTTPPLPPPTNTAQSVVEVPTNTPVPATDAQIPTATFTPAATAVPTVIIRVVDDNGNPIAGATVNLSNPAAGFAASFATTDDGQAVFTGVNLTTTTYTVEVSAPGFQSASREVTVAQPTTEISISLASGVTGRTTTITNLRNGPGLNFDILAEIPENTSVPILDVDSTEEWYKVISPNNLEGWVFAELIIVEGDLGGLDGEDTGDTGGTTPPTFTPVPPGAVTAVPTPSGTVTVTATPIPITDLEVPLTRPAPIAFEVTSFRATMNDLEFLLFQMGGLLDRVAQEGSGDCNEYLGYYVQLAALPTYSNVPGEWVDIEAGFQNVINSVLSTNEPTAQFCVDGGVGELSPFNYSLARNGINDGLSLFYALRDAADALISQGG